MLAMESSDGAIPEGPFIMTQITQTRSRPDLDGIEQNRVLDLSTIGFLSLVAALITGILGMGALPIWTAGKGLFFTFLLCAIAAFVSSNLKRPSLVWAVIDELRERQLRRNRMIRIRATLADRHRCN